MMAPYSSVVVRCCALLLVLLAVSPAIGEEPSLSDCQPHIDATIRDLASKALREGEQSPPAGTSEDNAEDQASPLPRPPKDTKIIKKKNIKSRVATKEKDSIKKKNEVSKRQQQQPKTKTLNEKTKSSTPKDRKSQEKADLQEKKKSTNEKSIAKDTRKKKIVTDAAVSTQASEPEKDVEEPAPKIAEAEPEIVVEKPSIEPKHEPEPVVEEMSAELEPEAEPVIEETLKESKPDFKPVSEPEEIVEPESAPEPALSPTPAPAPVPVPAPMPAPATAPVVSSPPSKGIINTVVELIFGKVTAERDLKWATPWQTHPEHVRSPRANEEVSAVDNTPGIIGGAINKFVALIFGPSTGERDPKWAEPWQTHPEHQFQRRSVDEETPVVKMQGPVGGFFNSLIYLVFPEPKGERDPKYAEPWQTHADHQRKFADTPEEKEKPVAQASGGIFDKFIRAVFVVQDIERDPKYAKPWQTHEEHIKPDTPVSETKEVVQASGGIFDKFVRLVFPHKYDEAVRDSKWAQPWQTHEEHVSQQKRASSDEPKVVMTGPLPGFGFLDKIISVIFNAPSTERDPKWATPWQTHEEHQRVVTQVPAEKKVIEAYGGIFDKIIVLIFGHRGDNVRDPKYARPWQTHDDIGRDPLAYDAKSLLPAAEEPTAPPPPPPPAPKPAPTVQPKPEVLAPKEVDEPKPEPKSEKTVETEKPVEIAKAIEIEKPIETIKPIETKQVEEKKEEPAKVEKTQPKIEDEPPKKAEAEEKPQPKDLEDQKAKEAAKFRTEEVEDSDADDAEVEAPIPAASPPPDVTQAPQQEEQEEDDEEQIILVPSALRSRDHIEAILGLDEAARGTSRRTDPISDATLKELKNLYSSNIKPLESTFKYQDISNRHMSDAEIFSQPLVLVLGPYSTGKSSFLNYLMDLEYTRRALRTGANPSLGVFRIIQYGSEDMELEGTALSATSTFQSLQKFGQNFVDQLRGYALNVPLLKKVTFVEAPGILEMRRPGERQYPLNDVLQWFIDRADLVLVMFDYTKLDAGYELEAVLDQLKGREAQVRILLNKADQIPPEDLIKVQGSLFWNLSPLLGASAPPTVYAGSFSSRPYRPSSPAKLFQAQEEALLHDIARAINSRVDNRIAIARRHAVRVRNHAQMVDCYLNTYNKNKGFLTSKHKLAEDITENPHAYNIYEGISLLTNVSRYDLPDPEIYADFFRLHNLYDFPTLKSTCTYLQGCPLEQIDRTISSDLPQLLDRYRKLMTKAGMSTDLPQGASFEEGIATVSPLPHSKSL